MPAIGSIDSKLKVGLAFFGARQMKLRSASLLDVVPFAKWRHVGNARCAGGGLRLAHGVGDPF